MREKTSAIFIASAVGFKAIPLKTATKRRYFSGFQKMNRSRRFLPHFPEHGRLETINAGFSEKLLIKSPSKNFSSGFMESKSREMIFHRFFENQNSDKKILIDDHRIKIP